MDQVREMIQRRGRREPLQQIVGSCSFCGYEIAVNRHVLVPRPETEILAEKAWTFLREMVLRQATPPLALDWGTGSGCLAVALAKGCPEAIVQGSDLSAEAVTLARKNIAAHHLTDRVRLFTRTRDVERRIATRFGKTLVTPYLDVAVVEFSSSLKLEDLFDSAGGNKRVLRESGRILGLPEAICSRPKLAAQYGSGISNVLKKLRKRGLLELAD